MRCRRYALLIAAMMLLTPAVYAQGQARPPGTGQDEPDPDEAPQRGLPKGHGAGGQGAQDNGMFQPPEDGAADDSSLPTGSITVLIANPAGTPMPGTPVTLGIVYNSVAKGESRKRVIATTNDQGIARFDNLESGSGVAYRPQVITDGTFSVAPFRLPEKNGMKAILHVYPTVESVESAMIVTQAILYTEVKDDRVQVQQSFRIYNFGKNAWVPKDLVVPLPENFTAFSTQQGMTDIGVDSVPKQGVRIHGTFPPGQHVLEFRWQLPYAGEAEVSFDVGMAPHVAASRVIAPASRDMKLDVPGFPPPKPTNDGQGQRALVTEKQLRRDEPPLKSVTIAVRGLPTEGPAKFVATLLALGGLGVGLVLGSKRPSKRDRKAERDRLLAERTDLERAHLAGDVGPKTYDAARRDLLDALARTFATEEPASPKPTRAKKPRAA